MAQLQGALEAHERSDYLIDVAQSFGIGVCGVGIIVICAVLIYVALLLRAAAMTLSKDMRTVMSQIATNKIRLEQIEFRLGIDRESDGSSDADRRKGS